MNDYLDKLYSWISSEDPTFSSKLSLEAFRTKISSDSGYRDRMYQWISETDPSFSEKLSPEAFASKVTSIAKPINEPQKKKIGTTAMESSLGGGLLASTGTERPVVEEPIKSVAETVAPILGAISPEVQAPLLPQTNVEQYFQQEKEKEKEWAKKEADVYEKKFLEGNKEFQEEYGISLSGTRDLSSIPQPVLEELKKRATDAWQGIKYAEELDKRMKAEKEKDFKLSNQAALRNPELAQLLNVIDDNYIQKAEEDVVGELNQKFSKYGLHFAQSGAGNYVTVRTADGLNEMEFKFGDRKREYSNYNDAYPDISSNRAALKRFIVENARNPEEVEIKNEDYITKALKARELRRVPMISANGEQSTVKFASVEADGKNYVIPTLFPKNPKSYTSNPQDWMEILDAEDAFAEAKKRGEVFEFDSKEDAQRFAEGEWKDIGIHDLEGKKFYEERGLDYMAEKRKWDEYNKVQDELDVINAIKNGDYSSIPPAERMRYPHLFGADGRPLYFLGIGQTFLNKRTDELTKRRDSYIEQTYDEAFDGMYNMGLSSKSDSGPVQRTREEFDLFLEKRRKEEIAKAVDNNLKAKEQYEVINKLALDSFGVPLEEISKVTPKDEKEAQVLDQINREKVRIDYTKNIAAINYENANIYYDRKWNKKVHGEYTENLAGAYNSLINGLNGGNAADVMWWTALGVTNTEDQGSREELIKKIVEIETQKQNAEESLTWSRYTLGREGTGVKAFLSDPFEFMTSITVGSFAQMLPLGVKIIPATVVGGTAIGGLTGGIPGAVKGFGQGLSIGQSATNFALEYGNAIYDVMYRKGYDLTDPKQVEAALMDNTVWSEGFERGMERAVPIGIADYLGSRLAGRVFNVSKTASIPVRAAALGAERLIVDPAVEMIGEYSAQVATGDDVDMSEVYLEGLGGFGMQAPSMSVKLFSDAVNNEMTAHAYNLTDINNLAMEGTSDERITSWVSNMKRLGKIDDDVSQRVLENVGLRREARELLGTGTGVLGMKSTATREVESRVMQLLAAKKEMSSTDSRKDIFGEKIKAVNNELAKIAETGKMVPESERSNFEVFSAFTQREGVSNYKVNGRTFTKKQFETWMENTSQNRLFKSRVQVLNDEDTKQKYEDKIYAIFKQKTGQVPVLTEAGISEEVEGGTPQAELEDIAGEGVQAEETLTEATPEQNETEAIKQDVVSSKTLLEQLNDSIPQPLSQIGKSVTERFQQGQMDEQETQSLLSALAERVNGKKRLTAEQQAVYDANKKRVDELSGLISQRNDLNTEVSELESILESRKATEAGKPKAAPDFTIDENVDAESANQVREIANRRKLGIPQNREVAFVARDKNGNVIGGAFRSLDKTTNKYSFDVAVSEEAEGRGVGSSLLDSVRNVPFEMRSTAPGATVEVDVVNPAMQQMLRRRGYVVTKRLGGDRVLMAPRKVKKAKVSPKTPEVVSAKNQTAVNELSSRSSRSRRNIIAQATRAVTVLSKILPDLEIFIHETSEEYNDTVSKLNGRENSAGNFAIIGRGPNQKLRIDINLSVANENTVAHEVAHAVMMKAFGEDVRLFKSFRNQISKILDSTTNEQLNQFAARYSEAESHEEFLVELAAVLSNNAQVLEQSLVQKIANAINNVVSRITKGKIVPFSGAANAMQIIDFMNTFAPAMAEGSTIEILNTQNPYSTGIAIRVDPNTFTQTRTRSKSSIGLYKFKSDLEVLKFVKLPTYSLKQVIQKYGGRVAIITSDATGYGVDSEGNPILGGFGYAQNKKNVEDGIGYASVNSSTAVGTYTAARNEFGDNQKVLVLIMVQPPWTTINNSYGANYFFRGLLELANTSPEEFAKTKESMLEWIDSSAKMQEFVTTPELIKIIKSINIDGIKSKEELNAYREELTNKLLELTTFDVRKIFMKGVLFDLNTTGSSTKTTYSKIALRNIGYTIQNFLSEYGDNTTLTDEMYLNDEGGYVVGGFEINTMTKETAPEFIESMQSKGITHPLFNGKLPGTNHFSLDGLYGVQDNFGRFAAPNWEVDNSKISAEEVNSLVRKYYADDSFYLKEKLGIPLEERGYSELKAGTKTKFKETYMRPLGFLMPVPKKVDVEVARGLGFKLNKGVTPEQIAQAEFVARSKSQQGVISKSQLPSKKQVYQQSLDNNDINTLRRSLRRVSPNSYTMEILDEIQNAKKMSKTDRYYIEKNVDDAIIEYIDNGITLSDVAGMIYEDGIFDTAREIDSYFVQIGRDESFGLFKRLSGLKTEGQEVVSKSQQAVDEYNSASKENKDDIRSKSRVVIHDDTGFVSVDFWVENLMGKTKYLDKVIESILKSRDVLKSGKVSPERVAKSFLITIASKGSGGGYYSAWSNKTGKKVSELFLETQDGKFWIRPESAAAAYLATPEGDSLVKSLINKTATDEQIKSFVDFLGFGFENSKTEDILGTMNSDGINKMTSLFNQNKGTDSAKLYDGAIKYLRGIAEGKTGFFNQFIGVSGRGVVDARELNAWIAGQMKLTEEQKAFKQKVAQSKKLSNVILNRIEQVGLKLGYSEEFASYIAHHAIWDGIKNSVTTHEGIYDVISKSQLPVEKTANALKDVSDTLTYSYGKNQERYAAYRNAGLIWHGGQSIIRQFDESKIKGGARGVLGYGYYFGNGSKPLDYGLEITFLNAKDLNLIDGDMPPSTDLVNKINNFVKKAKDRGDYSISYYADLMIKEHNNKPDKSIDEIRKTVQMKLQYDTEKFYSTILKELGIDGVQVSNNLQLVLFPDDKLNDLLVDPNIFTSEEYHKAKADKSNPELVKSVEDLIGVPEGQDVVSKSQLPVDEQVKSMSSLLPDELQTMQTIISTGRNNGFSDAAIVEFLKKKGFKVSDIMPQMQLNVDLFTTLPVEFANIEGGATKGMQLFADIRYELSKWVAAQKRNPTNIKFREEAQRILKNHPIYKKQSDSTKMSLQVSFDRSLSKKSDGQIQRRMDTLVNNIKQRKLAEKEFQQAKAKLANIIRSLLPSNEKIDVDALNKILNILSKSTANTIIKDIDTIVPLIEKQRQSIANRLVKDIKKTISDRAKTQKTASGKRRAKGIDEVGQAFFRTALDVLKDILSNNQTKIDERSQKYEDAAVDGTLAELYRKQENDEDLTSQEQELLDEVTAFDLLRDINLMDIEQLNEVMNVLQTVNKEAIKSLKIKRLERSAEFDALNASANNQLRQMFPILFDEDGNPIGKNKLVQLKREIRDLFNRMKVWEGAKKAYAMFSISEPTKINGFLRANLDHLGTVCNSLDNIPLGFRFFTDNIYRPLNRAVERMLRGEDIVEDYLDAMANSITGITKGRKEIETKLYSMGAVNLETKKGLFNADELLRIYALSLNDIQRDKLDKMGWSANVIEEIKTKLGPEVIEYANMVVEYLSNDYYESVNNVYRYVFNANLNRISNYFPTKTIPTKVDGDMLKNGDFNGIFSADNASALKDRTDTSGEIDLYMGFTVALENHYKSMERFKAFAKTTQNINSIFRNESVIMLMNETGYMKLLRTHINYAINPDAFRSSGTTDDRAVSWFVRKFVGVALGLKVWQASKQAVSSFANAYEKYNYFPSDSKTPNVIKKSLDLPAFMVDSAIVIAQFRKWYNEAYEKSATFRNRAEKSLSGDVAGIESGGNLYVIPESKKTGIIARARRKFRSARGFFTAVGDLAGVLGYMVNYRRNILNGMDVEDAIEEFNEYNQMQQSDRPTEKAPLQQSTFWGARMMTLFGSSTILMINNIFQSWGNISKSLKAKKMPRSEDMRRFALAYGVSHALFTLISNFFALTKGDEEDKKRVLGEMGRALLGAENIKTIPWFGASYELVENKMLGIDRPVSLLNDPLISTATKIYKGIDAGSIWQATKPIAEIVLGVSTDPIVGLNRMFSEGIDEDAMYDIIGISKSYRPGYGQKKKKEEVVEGVSKQDLKRFYPDLYEEKYKKKEESESEYDSYNKMVEEDMKQYREAMYGSE